jgi:hypothetical protein
MNREVCTRENCRFHHIKSRKQSGENGNRARTNGMPSQQMAMPTAQPAPRAQGRQNNAERNTVGRSGEVRGGNERSQWRREGDLANPLSSRCVRGREAREEQEVTLSAFLDMKDQMQYQLEMMQLQIKELLDQGRLADRCRCR